MPVRLATLSTVFAHVVAPLLVGGLVYLGLRAEGLLLFGWADWLGAGGLVHAWRDLLAPLAPLAPAWVRFSLPDALWTYALAWTLTQIWRDGPRAVLIAALAIPVALGPGAELGQWLGVIPGTCDPVDVALTALACVAGAAVAMACSEVKGSRSKWQSGS